MDIEYKDLVSRSIISSERRGIHGAALSPHLRVHQAHGTNFSLEIGRAALFLDTGLGKSLCSFQYADVVASNTDKPVLMFSPLGVVSQHKLEAAKFGFSATICNSDHDVRPGLNLANYERMHLFNPAQFGGLILDESSIIKSFSGTMSRQLMAFGSAIPFRLACTATPAPNDYMEIGQHSQFLGVMSSSEMLARWFIADQSEMGRYRLKRHAVASFWSWVASWARCAALPSDLGGDDTGYVLPPLDLVRHVVKTDISCDAGEFDGQHMLFRIPSNSATSIHKEKRLTANDRARLIADLVLGDKAEAWIVWCETDYDAAAVMALIPEAIEVSGKMTPEQKVQGLDAFSSGNARVLVTKPSIAGWGLNWQHCARVAFVGLSFSYEGFYQAIRRCWRYGQTRPVQVNVASAETEESIWQAIVRKRDAHEEMKVAMRQAMRNAVESRSTKQDYCPGVHVELPEWLGEKL